MTSRSIVCANAARRPGLLARNAPQVGHGKIDADRFAGRRGRAWRDPGFEREAGARQREAYGRSHVCGVSNGHGQKSVMAEHNPFGSNREGGGTVGAFHRDQCVANREHTAFYVPSKQIG